MAKTLNDTQRVILASAAVRDDLHVLPLPDTLRAPTHIVTKVMQTLLERGLIAEVTAEAGAAVWRQNAEGGKTTLIVTPAGLAAIDVDTEGAPTNEARTGGKGRGGSTKPATRGKPAPSAATSGTQSKQAAVIALLRRQQGASIPEMMTATGWQVHSVRGFISGALKRRLGLEVVSEKGQGGERRYHVAAIKAAND